MASKLSQIIAKLCASAQRFVGLREDTGARNLRTSDEMIEKFREWGYYDESHTAQPRILMTAGHGYGNVGDEAQCSACIDRWRRVAPDCHITLLSPNPAYTSALHKEAVEWAPRVAWFGANTGGPYFSNALWFKLSYWLLRCRIELSHPFLRADLPFSLLRPREAQILQLIRQHDIVHISGGGFLTGKTRSRLWENCLLMRCCQLLNKPYFLTGHNIGVFQSSTDERITRMGLSKARFIGLRDRGISEQAIAKIGIQGAHVQSTCDDALTCPRLSDEATAKQLEALGVVPSRPWIAVNFHHYALPPEKVATVTERFAQICDQIIRDHDLQLLFISMTPSDVAPQAQVIEQMEEQATQVPYSPDFKVVRGIIAGAAWVFTMKHHPIVFAQGEGVPVLGVSLDDYYYHKNRGALENTGHGDFLISNEAFYNESATALIQRIVQERSDISDAMRRWVDAMQASELDCYESLLSELNIAS